jgi:aminomethyltransferase
VTAGRADTPLRRTPLYDLHRSLGARLVAFAGYELPLQYADGIIAEHRQTRSAAGLFDVSHMGQIEVGGSGAAELLESLSPADVVGLPPGRQRYAVLTNAAGGVVDDIVIANLGERYVVVVNAARKAVDLALLLDGRGTKRCDIELLDEQALLAIQGPAAAAVVARLCPTAAGLGFMDVTTADVDGAPCRVSRSGYTGEDGFEIAVAGVKAQALAERLLADDAVGPVGLGARDSLRLEAGLCLYGQDLDETTTPVEAGLVSVVARARRAGGPRPAGYPGAEPIERQLREGVERLRVGLKPQSRVPVRPGCALVDDSGATIGTVTSGGFAPTLGEPAAMGYVAASRSAVGTKLTALVRDRELPVSVAALPFVTHRYLRAPQRQ